MPFYDSDVTIARFTNGEHNLEILEYGNDIDAISNEYDYLYDTIPCLSSYEYPYPNEVHSVCEAALNDGFEVVSDERGDSPYWYICDGNARMTLLTYLNTM